MRAASNRRWARNDAPCGTDCCPVIRHPSPVPVPVPVVARRGSTAVAAGQRPVHISRKNRVGCDETRRDETRRDSTNGLHRAMARHLRILRRAHPHTLADSHTLTRPGPTSPLPGAAWVAAPLDEHAGSRINYSLPGSRRPRRPSALWPSRSCPGARLAYPAPALPCPALVACIPWPMSLHSFTSPNTAHAPWRLSLALAARERLQGQPFAGTAGRPRRPPRRPRRRQSLCLLPN
jgi:hypothetical protein